MYKWLLVSCLAFLSTGCYQAEIERATTWGDYHIEMYSGGELVRTWTSNGKVLSENDSDGYYFVDKKSGKMVEVSGDVVITKD